MFPFAAKVTGIYLTISVLWILGSDSAVELLPTDYAQIAQNVKGIFFVIATSALLYLLISRYERSERRVQKHLRHTHKMKTFAKLAGGAAHDFNNLLTVILGNAEILYESDQLSKEDRRVIDAILNASEKGSVLTRSMLAFAREQNLSPKSVELSHNIAELTAVLRRTVEENVQIEFNALRSDWECLADTTLFETSAFGVSTGIYIKIFIIR